MGAGNALQAFAETWLNKLIFYLHHEIGVQTKYTQYN